MGAGGNLGHGGTRLALCASAQDDDVLARQQFDIVFGHKIRKIA